MRTSILALFVPCAALTMGVHAASGVPKSSPAVEAKRSIQAAYDKSNAALNDKDVDAVFASCAPDFVVIDLDGHQENLDTERQAVGQMFQVAQSLENTTEVQSVTLQGGGAVVSIREHQVLQMTNPTTQEQVVVTSNNICRDYWAHTTLGWQEKRTRVVASHHDVQGNVKVPNTPHW